ncbi:MAG TPA: hypothetical protein VHN80_14490 [Kineosporiaceae bacterium]|nr:hypothetical protein [Kineosporiaceae bacterium]
MSFGHISPQRPAGCGQRGRQRPQQPPKGDAAVSLGGEERTVDGGQGEAGELVGGRALRVVAEREPDLDPQPLQRLPADAADDGLHLPRTRGGRLHRQDNQQAEEMGVPLEGADGARHHGGQVVGRPPGPPVQPGQVGEEAIGAALHDGKQDPLL